MTKHEQIVDAVGEMEAERLIVAEFGTVEATFDHLVSVGTIVPEDAELSVADLIERLNTSAAESEMGRNLAGTPQTCREAAAEIAVLREQVGFWPQWATDLLAIMRKYTGPCPEDCYEGVDLPDELRTWFEGCREEMRQVAGITATDAHHALARKIWDEGHDRIRGKGMDASWIAEQAHIETLTVYVAEHDRRVTELLIANNREVENRQALARVIEAADEAWEGFKQTQLSASEVGVEIAQSAREGYGLNLTLALRDGYAVLRGIAR